MAAAALQSDIVAVGFSGCVHPNQVVDGLVELRRKLPAGCALWAGGSAPVLQRRAVPGVRVIGVLEEIAVALGEWRAEPSAAPRVRLAPGP
jgi:MerR family transcriptional regulator, light-induced transcriptional regulator